MSEKTELQKTFDRILENESFHELKSFTTVKALKALSPNDRSDLSKMLILYGERQCRLGDQNALKTFAWAVKASPLNDEYYYIIASTLGKCPYNEAYRNFAVEMLQNAIKINPEQFEYHYLLAHLTASIGISNNCMEQLSKACDYYAISLQKCPPEKMHFKNDMLWSWGMCCRQQGKCSGEASDYKAAIEKFKEAIDNGFNPEPADALCDYGMAYFDLSLLLGNFDFLLESKSLFEKALTIEPDHFISLAYLGSCYQYIYETYNDEESFEKANSIFGQVITLDEDNPAIWAKWGKLYAVRANSTASSDMLYLSIERFEKAWQIDPENLAVLISLIEVLIIYGASTDELRYFHEAEKKIHYILERNNECQHAWQLYGSCLYQMGIYFEDETYYHKAIEKIQHSLTLRNDDAASWYVLALAYCRIGVMQENKNILELSLKHFSRVFEFQQDFNPQFWNDWGVAYMELGQIDPQIQHYECAIEKFKTCLNQEGFPPTTEWLYNFGCSLQLLAESYVGDIHNKQVTGLYEEAIEVLSLVISKNPNEKGARFNIAESYSQLGRHTSSVEYLQCALDNYEFLIHMDGEDEYSWNSYGLAYLYLADLIEDDTNADEVARLHELAESKFSQAVALGSTEAFYNLACLYSLTERYDVAMYYIEKADQHDALPPLEDILHDEWLDGLRETPAFNAFIKELDFEDKN